MTAERKPEEKLVRLRAGDRVELSDGSMIRVHEIRAGRQVWLVITGQAVRAIDKVSTID